MQFLGETFDGVPLGTPSGRTVMRTRLIPIVVSFSAVMPELNTALAQERNALPFPPGTKAAIEEFFNNQIPSDPAKSGVVSLREAIDAVVAAKLEFQIESLCGADDSQDVELYDGSLGPSKDFVRSNEPMTAQIQWNDNLAAKYAPPEGDPGNVSGARWCTGTLIAEDRFLTAGHCFDRDGGGWVRPKKFADGQWTVISEWEIARNMHVNFGYQIDADTHAIRTPTVFPIVELLEHRRGDLDYALVKLGPGADGKLPGNVFGIRQVSANEPALGALLTLLQHPGGQPKKIEAGPLSLTADGLLQYNDLDTLGGSSGSGVLNEGGEVVGVHVLGGCTALGAGFNKAVPMTSIMFVSDLL